MKKAMMMIAMLMATVAMQAQTKFHDVEANDAQGPVKSLEISVMGQTQKFNFTKEGKMDEGSSLVDAVYDADGYMQSAKMKIMGNEMPIAYKWENGRVISQSSNMMGQEVNITYAYNDKGAVASQTIEGGPQSMTINYTDFQYDSHGNWISRKTSMMGQEMEQKRTITYYE